MAEAAPPTTARLPAGYLQRRRPPTLPVAPGSMALFRLGEQCNNKCPMCSNSGRPEAWFQRTDELLRRAEFLHAAGIPRVVLTGGEPTIHPGFWEVVARLNDHRVAWDINSNGRSFADPEFAARAVDEGLLRAILSLHSHLPETSMAISGVNRRGHDEIVRGIAELHRTGTALMLNCVLTRANLENLADYVDFCTGIAPGAVLKFCFPYHGGKGGAWEGIALTYAEVRPHVQALRAHGQQRGVELAFEGLPACVLGEPAVANLSRSGFGETHYLDDVTGDRLYPIAHIEAALSCYPPLCRGCAALQACPGIGVAYLPRLQEGDLLPVPPLLVAQRAT
jgi:pyruvate-formate lyase-activating enzyme